MEMQKRSREADFKTRDAENGDMYIEGYFAVFNSPYHVCGDNCEYIAPSAFDGTLDGDIRALINHDTTLVIGRTKAKTLELLVDERGLFGRVLINPNDQDAVNVYERVKRGDVSQCSFGFEVLDEETSLRDDGIVTWLIKAVRLHEVSVCTFPAYEATEVSARSREAAGIRFEAWKRRMLAKIEGVKNGN